MAVEFVSDIKRGVTEWTALPEDLEIRADMNGRHDLPDIEWLIDSMLMPHGQIEPVPIRKSAGKPVLTAGFSRWRAATEINKRGLTEKPFRLRCTYTQLTDKQALIANIHENAVRNPNTPMDDAYNLQKLINNHQMSESECAEVYRKPVGWVKDRLDLLGVDPAVEKQIVKGAIKAPAAKKIAKLSREHQKNLAKVAETNGKVTPADIAKETGTPAKKTTAKTNDPLELADAFYRLYFEVGIDVAEIDLAAKAYGKARGL